MIDIMEFLTEELKKFSPRVFNKYANDNAIFPYVVFNIGTSNIIEKDREDVVVEIDIWDYMRDGYDAVMNIETLTSRIDNFLKNKIYNGENSVLIFEKTNRLTVPDEDERVERRRLRYIVKFYDKNQ